MTVKKTRYHRLNPERLKITASMATPRRGGRVREVLGNSGLRAETMAPTNTSRAQRGGVEAGGGVTKAHVFVAMPFSTHLDDVFHYGIQAPVHAAGFLCDRMDYVCFTGEIIEWMKRKIEGASVVIANLSRANPNVYLEVGYAWGRGVPDHPALPAL